MGKSPSTGYDPRSVPVAVSRMPVGVGATPVVRSRVLRQSCSAQVRSTAPEDNDKCRKQQRVKNDTKVLFVSASAADEMVLGTLLAKDGIAGSVTLSTASDAQHFFDVVYSEEQFQVIVIDDRQEWSDWKSIVKVCLKHRPNALLVLLVASERPSQQSDSWLGDGVAAIYLQIAHHEIAAVA